MIEVEAGLVCDLNFLIYLRPVWTESGLCAQCGNGCRRTRLCNGNSSLPAITSTQRLSPYVFTQTKPSPHFESKHSFLSAEKRMGV